MNHRHGIANCWRLTTKALASILIYISKAYNEWWGLPCGVAGMTPSFTNSDKPQGTSYALVTLERGDASMISCRLVSPWWGCHLAGSRASPAAVWSERPLLQTRCSPCLSNSSATGCSIKGYESLKDSWSTMRQWCLWFGRKKLGRSKLWKSNSSVGAPFPQAICCPVSSCIARKAFANCCCSGDNEAMASLNSCSAWHHIVGKKYEDIKSHCSQCLMQKASGSSGEFYLFAAWRFLRAGCEEQERKWHQRDWVTSNHNTHHGKHAKHIKRICAHRIATVGV